MRSWISPLTTFGFMLILAVGCARQAEVVRIAGESGTWVANYERLLVVDMSGDLNRQQLFEDAIVQQLKQHSVDGFPAYPVLRFSGDVHQAELSAYGNSVDADGILLTRIVSVSPNIVLEEGRSSIQSSCRRGSLVDYFLYDHELIREPDSLKAAYDVVVVSSLYDIASRERVWSIQSTCFDKSNLSELLVDEARVIVQQLQIDDWI